MKKILLAVLLLPACLHAQIITTAIPGISGGLGIARDHSGNIYVPQFSDNNVIKITGTGLITTIAGTGVTGSLGDGGPATAAEFNGPIGVALDDGGNIYILENGNNAIRKINTTGIISHFAGSPTGVMGDNGDGGPADTAELFSPTAIATDHAGNVYVCDPLNHVRVINTSGTISRFAGSPVLLGTGGYSGDGGPATLAELNNPSALAFDAAGNLYISDAGNNVVRVVNTSGTISTFAGNGYGAGSVLIPGGYTGDGGPATAAELSAPEFGITFNNLGDVFVADYGNNVIRKINAAGFISTYAGDGLGAGTGRGGYTGDGGPADSAELQLPAGLVMDAAGNLFFAGGNPAIRKVSGISGMQLICTGDTVTLTANQGGGAWYSSAPGIAAVLSPGRIKGISSGSAIIWYVAGGDTAAAKVVVSAVPYAGVITGIDTLCSTTWDVLSDTAFPGGTWSTYNPAIMRFGNAIKGDGIDTAYYSIQYSCGVGTTYFVADFVDANPGAIFGPDSVCIGDTVTLTDTVTDGRWSIRDSTLAAVLGDGKFVGLAPGDDDVTYTKLGPDCAVTLYANLFVRYCTDTAVITGVKEIANSSLAIFPNPAQSEITVSSTNKIKDITIYNLLGQPIFKKAIDECRTVINVSALAPGIYFIKVNGLETRKFVKE